MSVLCRIAVFFLLFASLPAAAVEQVTGRTSGGAYYRIVVPDGWEAGDALVLYQHGFDFDPPGENPSLGPLLEVQLAQGYAVAASSYSQRGWALFTALDDNAELLDAFTQRFGSPGELVPFGGSMGGLIALKVAEDPRFSAKATSVFALCPAADGLGAWDFAFDLRLIYDQICKDVSGGELQQGSPPHTWALDLDQIPPNLDLEDPADSEDALRAMARVTQCTGLALPSSFRPLQQRERLAELKRRSRVDDEDFLATNLAYAVFAMSDVVRAPDKLGGRSPFESARLRYVDGEDINNLRPVHTDPFGRLDLAVSSAIAGTGIAKIISLHTSRDQLVVPAHQAHLRRRYPAERLVSAIVAEETPTHCVFTPAEGLAGWEALRAWEAGSDRPTVAQLQASCTALSGAGIEGPCRIDAAAQVGDFVAPPRRPFHERRKYSGVWFDPARSGEGIVIEELDDPIGHFESGRQRVLVSWFTFDVAGKPQWIVGEGLVYGDNSVLVRDAYEGHGRPFSSNQNPVIARWGSIELEFEGTEEGVDADLRIRWSGPAGHGEGTLLTYAQSSTLGDGHSPEVQFSPPIPVVHQRSGTYIVVDRPGDGVILQDMPEFDASAQRWAHVAQLVWYTFDQDGEPLWLVGAARGDSSHPEQTRVFEMYRASGARFGAAFDPDEVERVYWGRIEIESAGCAMTAMNYASVDPDFGSGRVETLRLTGPYACSLLE